MKSELQVVVFTVGREEYGLEIGQVQEINRLTPPTKIPQAPPFVEGVINLRGKIIPVIDLKKRFGLGASAYTDEARIVVVEIGGQTAGVIVDFVSEVLRLSLENVEPPPPLVSGVAAEYLQGVGKLGERLLLLLDLDKVLTESEKTELKEAAAIAEAAS